MKKLCSSFILLTIFPALFAQTFSSSPNQVIPDDNTWISFPINVSGLPSVIDTAFGFEQTCLSITHTWNSDLQVRLQSPDGTIVTLFSGIGGSDDNFTNTCLRADAAANVGSASAPFTGTFKPMGQLANFNNGQNPNGVWKLLIIDQAAQDIGSLLNWSITFGNNPAMPFLFTSSNLPIMKINTLGQIIPQDPKVLAHMQMIYHGEGVRNYMNQTDYYYEGDMLIEIQGFSGSSFPKTNYDFELVDANGNDRDTSILGMNRESDWMLKSEWTDPALMRNALTYEMARRMGKYAPNTRFCEVVLNGEYVGMYTITEKIKRSPERVDIAKLEPTDISGPELTGGYIIEMNINGDPAGWNSAYLPSNVATTPFAVEFKHVYPKANVIQPQQHNYIKAFTDSFENALNGPLFQDPTVGFRRFADESSFIDFCIVNEFSANYDSYGRSTFMYKEKITDGNKLHIGPAWDYDRAYATNPADGWVYEQTHPYWPFPFWWMKFEQDSVYMKKFYCRYHSLRPNVLATNSFLEYVDSTKALLQESYSRNLERWPDLGTASFDQVVNDLKWFITERLNWMDQQIVDPNLTVPVLHMNDTILCAGDVLEVDAGSSFTYIWSTGSDSSSAVFQTSGNYSFTATDVYGCTSTDNFVVDVSIPDAQFEYQSVVGLDFDFNPLSQNGVSWLWDFGDGGTSTDDNPNHNYANTGNYTVTLVITDAAGCTDTYTQIISAQYAGVEQQEITSVNIYPNPFTHSFTIQGTDIIQLMRIYNTTGQLIESFNITSTQKTLNLSHLSSGIYFIQMETEGKIFTQKLVKR